LKTLEAGLSRLDSYVLGKSKSGKELLIEGKFAFELNDTFGFPLDLTKLIANDLGFTIDEKGYGIEMQKQKERSRSSSKIDTEDWVVLDDRTGNEFTGYDFPETETKVLKYR